MKVRTIKQIEAAKRAELEEWRKAEYEKGMEEIKERMKTELSPAEREDPEAVSKFESFHTDRLREWIDQQETDVIKDRIDEKYSDELDAARAGRVGEEI